MLNFTRRVVRAEQWREGAAKVAGWCSDGSVGPADVWQGFRRRWRWQVVFQVVSAS